MYTTTVLYISTLFYSTRVVYYIHDMYVHLQICLLDFGASREYPKMFTDHYLKVSGHFMWQTNNSSLCTSPSAVNPSHSTCIVIHVQYCLYSSTAHMHIRVYEG